MHVSFLDLSSEWLKNVINFIFDEKLGEQS